MIKDISPNGTLSATEDQTESLMPDEAMRQIFELVKSLGYQLAVVALMPKTKTPVPIIEYLPDGVQVQLALVKSGE